jgi:hypothetical protein
METNKPQSWGVLNDDSQRFKDKVIKYMNTIDNQKWTGDFKHYYGIDIKGEAVFDPKSDSFSNILTIDDFCEIFLGEKKQVMYSEEDLKNAFHVGRLSQGRDGDTNFEQWLEKYNKK